MRGVPAKVAARRAKASQAALAGVAANGGPKSTEAGASGGTGGGESLPSGASPEKYRKILDAAVAVIAENGYFNSPVSKIAARAGVADGTIYLYFKSKDDVLRAAIDRMMQRFYGSVDEEFKHVTDPRAQLEAIGRIHLETVTVDRNMAVLMQTEVRQSAKFIAEFSQKHLARYIQTVREVVRRGQEQGVFRKELSAGVVAQVWFGAIDEMLTTAVFTGRDYDPKATARQVMDVVLNGIGT
jgi:TetR/AcrR family fatty acid metabolism transcriptional regulator